MKKIWKENRILLMLFIVLILCFIAIVVVALTFFYSKNTSKYGHRLDNMELYPITDAVKDSFKAELQKNEHVQNIEYNLVGRVFYLRVNFAKDIKLESAKNLIIKNISIFGEDVLDYYDFNITLNSDNFTIMGAKNSNSENISWNNNNPVETKNEEK